MPSSPVRCRRGGVVIHRLAAENCSVLRRLRVNASITSAELAKNSGIGRCDLLDIEEGRAVPDPETATRIAAALDTVFDLATLEGIGRRLR